MAFLGYAAKTWICQDVDINFERKLISPSILNGYFTEWADAVQVAYGVSPGALDIIKANGRLWIEDENDTQIPDFRKTYVDPFNLCRSIEVYNLKKEVNASEINDGRIDYFAVKTGLIKGVLSDVRKSSQLAQPPEILLDHVKMINNQNKTGVINVQYTQFNAWAIKLTETIASP